MDKSQKITFKKSKAEERVLIAKDIIKLIAAKTAIRACSGTYLTARGSDDSAASFNRDARTLLKTAPLCDVCAKGAIVYAMVRRHDKLQVPIGRSLTLHLQSTAACSDGEPYVTQLFGPLALNQMESAFENHDWRVYYSEDDDRLDAIMRNIIANKGTFKPKLIPPPRRTRKTA